MQKIRADIRERMIPPTLGILFMVLVIVSFLAALLVLMTVVRVVAG